ncbi:MAG: hypothetical protein V4676_04965 [Bacteroidota bacterium]
MKKVMELVIGPDGAMIERPHGGENTRNEFFEIQNPDEDENDDVTEEDLVLGDEDKLSGDEQEYEVVLEDDDLDEDDINEADLIIDTDDDIDDDGDVAR